MEDKVREYLMTMEEHLVKEMRAAFDEGFVGKQNNERTREILKQQIDGMLQDAHARGETDCVGVDVLEDPMDPTKVLIIPYRHIVHIEEN